MTHSSGVSFAASTDIFRPLMLRLGIVSLPSPVHDAAYGGNSLFGIGWHPPVRCQSVARMIVICSRGNVIWNCSKEIKLPDLALCIAAIKLTQFAAALTPPSKLERCRPGRPAVSTGERIGDKNKVASGFFRKSQGRLHHEAINCVSTSDDRGACGGAGSRQRRATRPRRSVYAIPHDDVADQHAARLRNGCRGCRACIEYTAALRQRPPRQ